MTVKELWFLVCMSAFCNFQDRNCMTEILSTQRNMPISDLLTIKLSQISNFCRCGGEKIFPIDTPT